MVNTKSGILPEFRIKNVFLSIQANENLFIVSLPFFFSSKIMRAIFFQVVEIHCLYDNPGVLLRSNC